MRCSRTGRWFRCPTIAELLAFGVVRVPLGMWLFARTEARAKRLGTLKRGG